MRLARLLLLPLLLASLSASAQAVKIDRIDIVGKGVYLIEAGVQTTNANTPTGTITAVTTVKNIEATTNIRARLGMEFGLQYVIAGEPMGADVLLDIVNIFPAPGLREPGAQPMTESKYSRTKKVGETVYLGYGFENDWEIVPGVWTFQIFHQGRKLAEQSFIVTR